MTPECKTGGCRLPPLRPEAARIWEVRTLLITLRELVDPGTICRICNVESADLYLLAAVENEVKRCVKQDAP